MILSSEPYGFDWTFVALERRLGVLQRVYKVYVGDRLLCGAVVGRAMLPLWPRIADWDDPEQWVSQRRLRGYEGVNVTSPYFLRRARGNFHLSRARLAEARCDAAAAAPARLRHSGVLDLRFDDGRTRRLLLPGEQNAERICAALAPRRDAGTTRSAR